MGHSFASETNFNHFESALVNKSAEQTSFQERQPLLADDLCNSKKFDNSSRGLSLLRRRSVVCLCSVAIFLEGINSSLAGPFFPDKAEHKGLSKTEIGIVMACFDLAVIPFSFFLASIMTPATFKFFFSVGMLWSGTTIGCFGCLEGAPSGNVFLVGSIVTRALNGMGGCMVYCTTLPIASQMLPGRASVVVTIIQLSMGLGLVCGPPIGSLMIPLGYKVQFLFVTFIELIAFVLAVVIVPLDLTAKVEDRRDAVKQTDFFKYLFHPQTLSVAIPTLAVYCLCGFRDSAYALYFEESLGISQQTVGFVFLASSGGYLLTGPFVGVLAEVGMASYVSVFTYILSSLSMFLLFLPQVVPELETVAWVLAILFLNGVTIACMSNPSYLILEKVAIKQGFNELQQIKALVANLFNLMSSSGKVVGSFLLGGVMNDYLGFYRTCFIYASTLAVTSTWFIVFLLKNRLVRKVFYMSGNGFENGVDSNNYTKIAMSNCEKSTCKTEAREGATACSTRDVTITELFLASVQRSSK